MKILLYARYSSAELQDDRSIEDQLADCRERAARQGWTVVDEYSDFGVTGNVWARPGLQAILARLANGNPEGIDIVLTDTLARLSRNQSDQPRILDLIRFAGAEWHTLKTGVVTPMHVAFEGLQAAENRRELAHNIRRGKRGRVSAGRIPGNRPYGYRKVTALRSDGELERGLTEIDPAQAEVVRRIFTMYLANLSPKKIAEQLNAEGVKGPSGGKWRASSINGDRVRKNGILQNELYVGRLVYNRTRRDYHPETRRRVIKINPVEEWQVIDVPELRIISDDDWNAVSERRQRFDGVIAHQQRRPKRLLSNLVKCGVCGGNYIIIGTDKWGCGQHRDGRTCTNNRTIEHGNLERRVLDGLQRRLLDPAIIEIVEREVREQLKRDVGDDAARRRDAERRLGQADAKVKRLVDAIAAGAGEFAEIKDALAAARADRDEAAAELADLDAGPVILLHPRIADDYRKQIAELSRALEEGENARLTAVPNLRALIDSVRVYPALIGRGTSIEVVGRLANVIAIATGQTPQNAIGTERMLKVVPLA